MATYLNGDPNGSRSERIAYAASMHRHESLKVMIEAWTPSDGDDEAKGMAVARAMSIAMQRSRIGTPNRGHRVSERLGGLNWEALKGTFDVLMDAGAHADFLGADGLPPLHAAVLEKNEEFVCHLLGKGATPDYLDQQGKTALAHCVETGNRSCARALLRAGADPNHEIPGIASMTDAAVFGRYSSGVDWMLIAYGGRAAGKTMETTMLEAAARVRDTERITELLDGMEHGAAAACIKLRSYVAQTMGEEQAAGEFLALIDAMSAKAVMSEAIRASASLAKSLHHP